MPRGRTQTTLWRSQPNPRNGQRDVQFPSQNQVKTKKKVFTSFDFQISSQNLVKTKKKGHHVSLRLIFLPKSSEDQKKRLSRLPTSNFPPKSSSQRPPGYAPESVRILKDFHRIPETASSNTRGSVEPRLRNTGIRYSVIIRHDTVAYRRLISTFNG